MKLNNSQTQLRDAALQWKGSAEFYTKKYAQENAKPQSISDEKYTKLAQLLNLPAWSDALECTHWGTTPTCIPVGRTWDLSQLGQRQIQTLT